MNIVYSSSEYYFKPTLVSIFSLLKNSSAKHEIYLLSSKVSSKNKTIFNDLVSSMGSKPHILEIDDVLEKKAREFNFPIMRENFSTYARLFLSEILTVESVLLLDSDTLVVGEIQEIIKEINNNYVMFASRDYVVSNKFSRHEDPELSMKSYFNMGVLYINLENWREKNLTQIIKNSYDKKYKLKIADQTIVNKYLHKFISEIDVKFNWYTYFRYNFDYEFYLSQNNCTQFLNKDDFINAKENPIVIHYIGTWFERPWFRRNICKTEDLYRSYWLKIFKKSDLYRVPSIKLRGMYDYLSLFIFRFFGIKAYYNFRYKFIQMIKSFL